MHTQKNESQEYQIFGGKFWREICICVYTFLYVKRNQRRIHGNRDVGHDLNFYGSYLPIVWNLNHDEYIKNVYGSMENFPFVFSQVPYEMFKLEQKRFYAERRGRMINFKHDDSELFEIIGQGLDNLESQSNDLLTP